MLCRRPPGSSDSWQFEHQPSVGLGGAASSAGDTAVASCPSQQPSDGLSLLLPLLSSPLLSSPMQLMRAALFIPSMVLFSALARAQSPPPVYSTGIFGSPPPPSEGTGISICAQNFSATTLSAKSSGDVVLTVPDWCSFVGVVPSYLVGTAADGVLTHDPSGNITQLSIYIKGIGTSVLSDSNYGPMLAVMLTNGTTVTTSFVLLLSELMMTSGMGRKLLHSKRLLLQNPSDDQSCKEYISTCGLYALPNSVLSTTICSNKELYIADACDILSRSPTPVKCAAALTLGYICAINSGCAYIMRPDTCGELLMPPPSTFTPPVSLPPPPLLAPPNTGVTTCVQNFSAIAVEEPGFYINVMASDWCNLVEAVPTYLVGQPVVVSAETNSGRLYGIYNLAIDTYTFEGIENIGSVAIVDFNPQYGPELIVTLPNGTTLYKYLTFVLGEIATTSGSGFGGRKLLTHTRRPLSQQALSAQTCSLLKVLCAWLYGLPTSAILNPAVCANIPAYIAAACTPSSGAISPLNCGAALMAAVVCALRSECLYAANATTCGGAVTIPTTGSSTPTPTGVPSGTNSPTGVPSGSSVPTPDVAQGPDSTPTPTPTPTIPVAPAPNVPTPTPGPDVALPPGTPCLSCVPPYFSCAAPPDDGCECATCDDPNPDDRCGCTPCDCCYSSGGAQAYLPGVCE